MKTNFSGKNYRGGTDFVYAHNPIHDLVKRNYIDKGDISEEIKDFLAYYADLISPTDPRDNVKKAIQNPIHTDEDFQRHLNKHAGVKFSGVNLGTTMDNGRQINDLRPLWKLYNDQRRASRPRETWDSRLKEIAKFINARKAQLGSQPLAEYIVKQPPESVMTQKARDLEETQRKKGKPYKNKIEHLKKRASSKPGFKDSQIEEMLRLIKEEGFNKTQNIAKKYLEEEFKDNYQTRGDIFNSLTNTALDKNKNTREEDLERLSKDIGFNQHTSDMGIVKTIRNLGDVKERINNDYINELRHTGNQKHIHGELEDKAKKKGHDIEIAIPHVKLNQLEHDINNISFQPGNPDSGKQAMERSAQALAKFGIQGVGGQNNRANTWKASAMPEMPAFTTEDFLEPINDELDASYLTLSRFDPKLREDKPYQDRKAILQDIYGKKDINDANAITRELENKAIGNVAINKTLQDFSKKFSDFDPALEEAVKKGMNRLANKHIRHRTYGSPQHIRQSEKMVEDLTAQFNENRHRKLVDLLNTEQDYETKRLATRRIDLDEAGINQYEQADNLLKRIRSLNDTGAEKWTNLQKARSDIADRKLKLLGFGNVPQPSGNFSNILDPNYKSEFDKRTRDYLNNNPFGSFETPQQLNIEYLKNLPKPTFSETKKADDPYMKSIYDTLKKEPDFNNLSADDLRFAGIRNSESRRQETNRRKAIEDEIKKRRQEALQQILNNVSGMNPQERNQLKNMIDVVEKDPNNAKKLRYLESIAEFLENKKLEKFGFNPDIHNWQKYETGKFDPADQYNILKAAKSYIK